MQNEKFKNTEQNAKLNIKGRAYSFALSTIKLIDTLSNCRANMIIGDQLLRSATSIGANIVEAQAASSRKDFKNFLNHALKSANETKFWLSLLKDSGKKPENEINPLLNEAKELSNILASSILTLKNKTF
ncbi:MAG: four helix bundle protein [Nitrospirae bacterium]|nr:four helix bundle protein [Nitrospirota bacterium]